MVYKKTVAVYLTSNGTTIDADVSDPITQEKTNVYNQNKHMLTSWLKTRIHEELQQCSLLVWRSGGVMRERTRISRDAELVVSQLTTQHRPQLALSPRQASLYTAAVAVHAVKSPEIMTWCQNNWKGWERQHVRHTRKMWRNTITPSIVTFPPSFDTN